jgi:hypothetical protein
MGRYTTVQAFKDTDTRVPALSYELATGKVADDEGNYVDKKPTKPEDEYDAHGRRKGITEKVVNPYGSTAGAGSGEFHTYRHARDREVRRLERAEAAKKKAETKQVRARYVVIDGTAHRGCACERGVDRPAAQTKRGSERPERPPPNGSDAGTFIDRALCSARGH